MSHAERQASKPVPPGLGDPEWRVEGRAKVTGEAAYVADLERPGMLHARFLGSPVPHARLVRVEVEAARRVRGVHAVLTGQDAPELRFGRRLFDWPVLARERVRFVGDRVAVVAAETPEAAEEALRLIQVDYKELPAILSVEAALSDDSPIMHPDAAAYAYVGGDRPPVPHPNIQGHRVVRRDDDDIEDLLRDAPHTFEHVFHTPAQHPGYLEPHATLVWMDVSGMAHVATTNKSPFSLRSQLARTFGIAAETFDVDAGFIGGDFGGKGVSWDEYACFLLARATGRPVRAVMSYVDELRTMSPRHEATIVLRTAVDTEGRLLAHHSKALFDGGAYAGAKPLPHLTLAGGTATLAAYRVPHVRLEVTTVYTNHAPAGHMRAPGEVQALFAGESHLDEIARELGQDPLEFRIRNAVREGEAGLAGERFREARAIDVLRTLERETGWGARSREPDTGWGLALSCRHVGAGKTSVRLRAETDGSINITTGAPDQGGGAATVMQRVAAASLGVPARRVTVQRESTASAPEDPGVGGSRVTHITSRAVESAVEGLIDELWERASAELGEGTRIDGATLVTVGGERLALADAVSRLAPDGIEVEGSYDGSAHGHDEPGDFDFAGYAIQVHVDRETGQPTIRQAILAADVGTVINPVAHRGQLLGGFAFGLGAALMEELVREDGSVVGATLGEVKLPTQLDVPPLRIVLLPTAVGPGAFGAKMSGELSNTGVAPAIANAIADAVGARVTRLPLTAERILRSLPSHPR